MTSITIVRHGQTDWNRAGKVQGQTDIPLNETGREQAGIAAEALGGGWDVIASSGLSRALETARIIAAANGDQEVVVDDGLAERAHGELEGLTLAERERRFASDEEVPGLETREAVVDRVVASLAGLVERAAGGRLLVVSHGGVIGSLLRHASGGTLPAAGHRIENGSAYEFRLGADGELLHVDTAAVAPVSEVDGRQAPTRR